MLKDGGKSTVDFYKQILICFLIYTPLNEETLDISAEKVHMNKRQAKKSPDHKITYNYLISCSKFVLRHCESHFISHPASEKCLVDQLGAHPNKAILRITKVGSYNCQKLKYSYASAYL